MTVGMEELAEGRKLVEASEITEERDTAEEIGKRERCGGQKIGMQKGNRTREESGNEERGQTAEDRVLSRHLAEAIREEEAKEKR